MAKYRTERDEARAVLFSRWFSPLLETVGIGDFTRKLYGDSLSGGAPRAVVRAWRDATATIGPERAFRVGQTFQALGVDDADGLVALVAAGYFGNFTATLRGLTRAAETRYLVPDLVAIAPLLAAWRQGCIYDPAVYPEEVRSELNADAAEIHRRLESRFATGRAFQEIRPRRAPYKRTGDDEATHREAVESGLAPMETAEREAIERAFAQSFAKRYRPPDAVWVAERDAVAAALQAGAVDPPSWYAIYPALVAWSETLYARDPITHTYALRKLDPKFYALYRRIAFNETTGPGESK